MSKLSRCSLWAMFEVQLCLNCASKGWWACVFCCVAYQTCLERATHGFRRPRVTTKCKRDMHVHICIHLLHATPSSVCLSVCHATPWSVCLSVCQSIPPLLARRMLPPGLYVCLFVHRSLPFSRGAPREPRHGAGRCGAARREAVRRGTVRRGAARRGAHELHSTPLDSPQTPLDSLRLLRTHSQSDISPRLHPPQT